MSKRVVLGMSGGVDSSVCAILLKEMGYDVVGVFMKNWSEEKDGVCTSKVDQDDASIVASQVGIPIFNVNFEKEYWDRVFSYFLEELKKGNTPNPDVLCNQEIKFKAFLNYALSLDADYIAMGHYARVKDGKYLLKGKDENKDQSYFLSRITEKALSKTIFPLGDLKKTEVREIAKKYNLETALKKDSTGICFIGERNFNEFLDKYLLTKSGNIVDIDTNEIVGEHTGLIHYTIGQRKGIGIGGLKSKENGAYFVFKKDVKNNILYVAKGKDNPVLYSKEVIVENFHYINNEYDLSKKLTAKFRYRQKDIGVEVEQQGDKLVLYLDEKTKAITPGQVAVLYDGDICIGGGFISND